MKLQLKPNKSDIGVLITIIIFIADFVVSLIIDSFNVGDNIVVVRYNNEVVHRMNLQVDETYTMKKEDFPLLLGDLTVEVKDGKVGVVEQTSNYNYCELVGSTDKKGTAIICAPNGVVITIEGYEEPCSDWGPCLGGDE